MGGGARPWIIEGRAKQGKVNATKFLGRGQHIARQLWLRDMKPLGVMGLYIRMPEESMKIGKCQSG